VGGGLSVAGAVVDMHELNARATPQGPKNQAADATKTVDADFHGVLL
jgi:hypothetical protein